MVVVGERSDGRKRGNEKGKGKKRKKGGRKFPRAFCKRWRRTRTSVTVPSPGIMNDRLFQLHDLGTPSHPSNGELRGKGEGRGEKGKGEGGRKEK